MNGSDSNSFPLEAHKNEGTIFSNIAPSFSEPEVRASREKITSNMTAFIGAKSGFNIVEAPLPNFLNKLKDHYQENQASNPSKEKPSVYSIFHSIRQKRGIFNACRLPDFTH